MTNQRELAARLARELEVAGHDDITALDLLDVLATAGLRLEPDESGAAASDA